MKFLQLVFMGSKEFQLRVLVQTALTVGSRMLAKTSGHDVTATVHFS